MSFRSAPSGQHQLLVVLSSVYVDCRNQGQDEALSEERRSDSFTTTSETSSVTCTDYGASLTKRPKVCISSPA